MINNCLIFPTGAARTVASRESCSEKRGKCCFVTKAIICSDFLKTVSNMAGYNLERPQTLIEALTIRSQADWNLTSSGSEGERAITGSLLSRKHFRP